MSTSGGTAGVGAGGGTTSASGGAKGGSAGAKGSGDDEEVDPRDAAAMQHLDDMIQRVIDFEPEMFKLRTPASLWRRTAAGLQDLAVAVTVGAAAALPPVLLDLITEDTAAVVGVIGATAMWSLRDCCTSEGNRSWGKKTWGLELVFFSGDLPPRALTFIRNLYWWLLPAAMFYPLAQDFAFLAAATDLSAVVLTPDRRKVGDWLVGTTVVRESSDRAERVQLAKDLKDLAQLEHLMQKMRSELGEEGEGGDVANVGGDASPHAEGTPPRSR